MDNSFGIGYPKGQVGLAIFALKFSLLLLAMVFFCERLQAQCDGFWRGLNEFTVTSSSHIADFDRKTVLIDLEISGTKNASEIALALESDIAFPAIDSMQLEWVAPSATGLLTAQLSWSQDDNGHRLDLDLLLDACKPVVANAFGFRIKVFCAMPVVDGLRLSALFGGIVQVDVIQAKMNGLDTQCISELETQRIYMLDGSLIREVDRALQSAPATKGFSPGIYLLQRLRGGVVIGCEKVLVW